MRPTPPAELLDHMSPASFVSAPDVTEWIQRTFLDLDSPLSNQDHLHLLHAKIGVLWTNVGNSRQMRSVVGQCEIGKPRATHGKWAKARAEIQVKAWFGIIPDFILTFDAEFASNCSDDEFCALVEHELYHAGQDRDEFGQPKFTQEGRPYFAIRGHDVEEFVGVVRRYGADASGVKAMIEAATKGPEIARASIAQACGTCMLRAA